MINKQELFSKIKETLNKSLEKDFFVKDKTLYINPQLVDLFPSTPDGSEETIEKGTVTTPMKDGKVDYDSVRVGDSIWVTVHKTGPLYGRHLLITKRKDGLFELTGGFVKRIIEGKGGKQRTAKIGEIDPRKHIAWVGRNTPDEDKINTIKMEREIDEDTSVLESEVKKLSTEEKKELKENKKSAQEAVNIVETETIESLEEQKEKLVNKIMERGIGRTRSKEIADLIMLYKRKKEKDLKDMLSIERWGAILEAEKELEERPENSEKIFGDLNKKLNSLSDKIDVSIDIDSLIDEDFNVQESIIANTIDEAAQKIIDGETNNEQINEELNAEGLPSISEPKNPIVEINVGVKALNVEKPEDIQKIKKILGKYHESLMKRTTLAKMESRLRKAVEPLEGKEIDDIRNEIKDIFNMRVDNDELRRRNKELGKLIKQNNQSINFSYIVNKVWENYDSLLEDLKNNGRRIGKNFYSTRYINDGAMSAFSALSEQFVGTDFDTSKLLENLSITNIETTARILARRIRLNAKKEGKLNQAKLNSIISNLRINAANSIGKTEKIALEKHESLKKQYVMLKTGVEGKTLPQEFLDKDEKFKILSAQMENLGSALGSMEATASLFDALVSEKTTRNKEILIDFGKNSKEALKIYSGKVFSKKGGKGNRGEIVITPEGDTFIKANTNDLDFFLKTIETKQIKGEELNKIKNNISGAFVGSDGELYRKSDEKSYPFFKNVFKNRSGEMEQFHPRLNQDNDINWLLASDNKGGVITRTMGSGKTLTSLGYFARQLKENPKYTAFQVVPEGMTEQWTNEAKNFTTLPIVEVQNVDDLIKTKDQKDGKLILLTHKKAAELYKEIEKHFPNSELETSEYKAHGIFIDEPQILQSKSKMGNFSVHARALMKLNAENRIATTGTPIKYKMSELWDLVNWSTHKNHSLGSRKRFESAYGGIGAGTLSQGELVSNKLRKEIASFVSGDAATPHKFITKHKDIMVRQTAEQVNAMKKLTLEANNTLNDKLKKAKIKFLESESKKELKYKEGGEIYKKQPWVSQYEKKKKEIKEDLLKKYRNILHGTGGRLKIEHNGKIKEFLKNIQSVDYNPELKHVIFVDSASQRNAIERALAEQFNISSEQIGNRILNLSPFTTAAKDLPKDMKNKILGERASKFQDPKNTDARFIIIDKESSTGFNLQAGSVLHFMGTPEDGSTFLQAQARLARAPREGDVEILNYTYRDNFLEAKQHESLRREIERLKAVNPGGSLGRKKK